MNKQIVHLYTFIAALFGILVFATSWWTVWGKDGLEENTANRRPILEDLRVPRGDILASDGTVLALISTPGDDPVDQLRAGEALSAVLLGATHYGLATDPISQPLEVPATRSELRSAVLGGAAEPQVLLRLGWAPMSTVPVPRSGRRPLADTIAPLD